MRVLMITDVFPNNMKPDFGTFSLERVKCLKNLAEVKVVAPVPFFPGWRGFKFLKTWHEFSKVLRKDVVEGVEIFHPRRIVIPRIGGFTNGVFYYLSLLPQVKKIYKSYPFDVIDAHFVWPDGYAALKAGKQLNVPVCITAHGTDVNLMPSFAMIRSLISKTVKQAARVVAVSQALADIVLDLGASSERVKVIHNGVDLTKFKRIEKKEARSKLGLGLNSKILISVGALIPRKGHEFLIEAVDLLVHQRQWKDLKLVIIGSGALRGSLQERIIEHNLKDHVLFAGNVPHAELYSWLSASDIFCLASSREGWPTVFFEAWACGIPVVATAVHGAPEAICSPQYGLLVDKQDPGLVAEKIEKALKMRWNPEAMITYAAENSWEKMVQLMYEELKAIADEHRQQDNPKSTG